MTRAELQTDDGMCPKPIEVVMKLMRITAIVFAVTGPGCLYLIMCAAYREASADGSFYSIVFLGSAAIVFVSVVLAFLSSYTLAGRLWAYYTFIALLGLCLGLSVVSLLVHQTQNWYILVAPAIFFFLLVSPSAQYRKFAQMNRRGDRSDGN